MGAASCATPANRPAFSNYTAEDPSSTERYCAWYGDARDDVLYFGQSASGSGEGPSLIGRFDLRAERLLAPLDVGLLGDRSGVWDVLAHPNGRIYFTTGTGAGYANPATHEQRRFRGLGVGLTQLALGPEDSLLVTRYASDDPLARDGSIVVLGPDGAVRAEHRLESPEGYTAAPKAAAYDRLRDEIWVTTDLLPDAGGDVGHATYVLTSRGREQRRIMTPEVQFVAFADDGTRFAAEVEQRELWLRIVEADGESEPGSERRVLLDAGFPHAFDFAQDIKLTTDGRAVVTRWSGWVHVVDPSAKIRSIRMPYIDAQGLYYTAVLSDHRICATHCADVSVICADAP